MVGKSEIRHSRVLDTLRRLRHPLGHIPSEWCMDRLLRLVRTVKAAMQMHLVTHPHLLHLPLRLPHHSSSPPGHQRKPSPSHIPPTISSSTPHP